MFSGRSFRTGDAEDSSPDLSAATPTAEVPNPFPSSSTPHPDTHTDLGARAGAVPVHDSVFENDTDTDADASSTKASRSRGPSSGSLSGAVHQDNNKDQDNTQARAGGRLSAIQAETERWIQSLDQVRVGHHFTRWFIPYLVGTTRLPIPFYSLSPFPYRLRAID